MYGLFADVYPNLDRDALLVMLTASGRAARPRSAVRRMGLRISTEMLFFQWLLPPLGQHCVPT